MNTVQFVNTRLTILRLILSVAAGKDMCLLVTIELICINIYRSVFFYFVYILFSCVCFNIMSAYYFLSRDSFLPRYLSGTADGEQGIQFRRPHQANHTNYYRGDGVWVRRCDICWGRYIWWGFWYGIPLALLHLAFDWIENKYSTLKHIMQPLVYLNRKINKLSEINSK